MLFHKKRPKTVAEVGVQVGDTSEEQLLTTISLQVAKVNELCAKQDRCVLESSSAMRSIKIWFSCPICVSRASFCVNL